MKLWYARAVGLLAGVLGVRTGFGEIRVGAVDELVGLFAGLAVRELRGEILLGFGGALVGVAVGGGGGRAWALSHLRLDAKQRPSAAER